MASLLSKDEIINIAFIRKIDAVKIPLELIESVQNTHLKKILGKDFYDLIVATPTNYPNLMPYIKNLLAHYVKFYILPEIWVDISSTGINKINGNNRTQGTSEEFNRARQNTQDFISLYIKLLTDYLEDNEALYPDYSPDENYTKYVTTVAGIVFETNPNLDIDEYYMDMGNT